MLINVYGVRIEIMALLWDIVGGWLIVRIMIIIVNNIIGYILCVRYFEIFVISYLIFRII